MERTGKSSDTFFTKATSRYPVGNHPNHFTAVIACRRNEKGVVETIVVDSTQKRPRDPSQKHQTKAPGGRNDGAETPLQTGLREFKDETGLEVICLAEPELVHVEYKRGHTKYAYLIPLSWCTGRMHTEPHEDKNSVVMPRVVTLEQAIKEVYCPPNNLFHIDAFLKVWERLHCPEARI